MQRRHLLVLAPALALPAAAWSQPAGLPRYTVSAGQLQQAVAQRFPMRFPVAGLLDLDLQAPQLRLLPEANRLGAELVVQAAGPALHRSYSGTLDLDFALRYEPADQSIRAHKLRVHALRLPGLAQRPRDMLEAYGPLLAQQALHEVVLHRLREKDLAMANAMGLEPGEITVTARGLVVDFVVKPRPPAG